MYQNFNNHRSSAWDGRIHQPTATYLGHQYLGHSATSDNPSSTRGAAAAQGSSSGVAAPSSRVFSNINGSNGPNTFQHIRHPQLNRQANAPPRSPHHICPAFALATDIRDGVCYNCGTVVDEEVFHGTAARQNHGTSSNGFVPIFPVTLSAPDSQEQTFEQIFDSNGSFSFSRVEQPSGQRANPQIDQWGGVHPEEQPSVHSTWERQAWEDSKRENEEQYGDASNQHDWMQQTFATATQGSLAPDATTNQSHPADRNEDGFDFKCRGIPGSASTFDEFVQSTGNFGRINRNGVNPNSVPAVPDYMASFPENGEMERGSIRFASTGLYPYPPFQFRSRAPSPSAASTATLREETAARSPAHAEQMMWESRPDRTEDSDDYRDFGSWVHSVATRKVEERRNNEARMVVKDSAAQEQLEEVLESQTVKKPIAMEIWQRNLSVRKQGPPNDSVNQVCSITGVDRYQAISFLTECKNDVDQAVGLCYDTMGNGSSVLTGANLAEPSISSRSRPLPAKRFVPSSDAGDSDAESADRIRKTRKCGEEPVKCAKRGRGAVASSVIDDSDDESIASSKRVRLSPELKNEQMVAAEPNDPNSVPDALLPSKLSPNCCRRASLGSNCVHQRLARGAAKVSSNQRAAIEKQDQVSSSQTIIPEFDMDAKFVESLTAQRADIDAKVTMSSYQTRISSFYEAVTSVQPQHIDDVPRYPRDSRTQSRFGFSDTPPKLNPCDDVPRGSRGCPGRGDSRAWSRVPQNIDSPIKAPTQPSSPSSNLSFEGFRELPQLPEKPLSEILKARYSSAPTSPSTSPSAKKKEENEGMKQAVDAILQEQVKQIAKEEGLHPFTKAIWNMHTYDDHFPVLVRGQSKISEVGQEAGGVEIFQAIHRNVEEKKSVEVQDDERFQNAVNKAVGTFMEEHAQSMIEKAVEKALAKKAEAQKDAYKMETPRNPFTGLGFVSRRSESMMADEKIVEKAEMEKSSLVEEESYGEDFSYDDESMINDYDAEEYFDNGGYGDEGFNDEELSHFGFGISQARAHREVSPPSGKAVIEDSQASEDLSEEELVVMTPVESDDEDDDAEF